MPDAPLKIETKHRKRNIIISIGVLVALVLFSFSYAIFGLHLFEKPATQTQTPVVATDSDDSSVKTLEGAKTAISSYYSLLSEGNSQGLLQKGFEAASNALEMQWLKAMEYSILSGSSQPDIEEMPQSVGTYAGNRLYAIKDFFKSPTAEVSKSIVTGTLGYEGWVYYDVLAAKWVLIDPTIPTATQAPEAGHVSRVSEDKAVSVDMSSPGAFSNPWWAYTMVSVDIASSSKDYPVFVKANSFDEGMTVSVPESLLVEVPVAKTETVKPDGNVDAQPITSVVPSKSAGIVVIYRGVLSGFTIDKIGQQALRIDGNISPVTVETAKENVTPVFAIGTASSSDIQKLLNEEEMETYGANADKVEILPELSSSTNGVNQVENITQNNGNSNTPRNENSTNETSNQNQNTAGGR